MSSPEPHGSSGFTDSESSAESPDYQQHQYTPAHDPAPRGERGSSYNFYTHPARTSVLDANGELLLDPTLRLGPAAAANSTDMEHQQTPHGDMRNMWRPIGSLPSFSRAFDFLASDSKEVVADVEPFFVPSYLRGSAYLQKLEEAHNAKLEAQKEGKRSKEDGQDLGSSGLDVSPLPPGGHRGILHTVLERTPFDGEDNLAPLPTRLNAGDMWTSLEVTPDMLGVKYAGPKGHHDRDHEASAIRANHYIPPQCGIYYFEVQIISGRRDDTTVAVGFSTRNAALSRPVGWEPESWGYHGDDGRCFTGQNIGRPFGPVFNTSDVIGCGVNFKDHTAFFTKNGQMIGVAFHDVTRSNLYPAISLKKQYEQVRVNFGQSPFVFNIDDLMKEQRLQIQRAISVADTSQLEPGLSETDLIQALVLQFLQHDGYVETARAFAEDLKLQKEALNMNPDVTVDGVSIKDDEDANNRQRIRRAILDGEIDLALKYTNTYYPQVLRDNEQVYFKLRCRKFIEMVRKAAELAMKYDGKGGNELGQEMDLDVNSSHGWGGSMETDGGDHLAELAKLENKMLSYGQALQAEYAGDPRKEINKALNEIWALVAYKNPLKEPQVSHLLDGKGRVTVAEELNSAILSSLGKSSRAALETLYAQTSVLLEELRKDGGSGAFITLRDVVDSIQQG
ncbi:SPRY-domain-containing protein [Trichoderma citrinoviride]|uniref:SPRY-domain-containing protein n=1 Tax=Trichoderma citrinoviride TaxID=58853 RepID=A0A2T4BHA4_9HYPO|nr:SPRY-domain-containing protein [Trichoderma citrinoviride]PTB68692.1 SPRY-domain-containing protein [Trichoderma citrinoviride]